MGKSLPVYQRILLKLSGEALLGQQDYGIDPVVIKRVGAEIIELLDLGVQVGLVIGGGMALVSAVFSDRLRKRILAAYQGVWMIAQLLGPAVGGVFAQLGWWRGSFWTMVPIILIFAFLDIFRNFFENVAYVQRRTPPC